MSKPVFCLFIYLVFSLGLQAQPDIGLNQTGHLNWELNHGLYLKLANDSSYVYDIRQLFHIPSNTLDFQTDFVYYPVNLDVEYINSLTSKADSLDGTIAYKTLWGTMHESLGGGWVHFVNCILYAFETGQLSLTAPLMQRPLTKWKPRPVTQSYLRTRKWKYYVPVVYSKALREYKTRISEGQLGDLANLPSVYIDLFLKTNDKQYRRLKEKGDMKSVAIIDLVKLVLGGNFLGEPQIVYISSAVLNSVRSYSASRLPSVVVFSELGAAAMLTLDQSGYKINALVFRDALQMRESEIDEKTRTINSIIQKVNAYNQESFKRRLDTYYKP